MKKKLLFIYLFSYSLIAHSQTADFTYQSTTGLYCNPAKIQFTQTFTGKPKGFAWSFGNGTGSNNQNPIASYNTAGTFTVKLIVIYEQNAISVTKTITINPLITATINYDRNFICKPGGINFTAISNGNIGTYDWDFGDGSVIAATSKNITHNYSGFGVYNVMLKATDISGCSDTAMTTITIKAPVMSGTLSPDEGCVPAQVNFNTTVALPDKSFVKNYAWSFNDGSTTSTTANSTNHIYNTPGTYIPVLNITTNDGCTGNFSFAPVAFGTPPVNITAHAKKTIICGSEIARFYSKATNANEYYWDFGDNNSARVKDTIAQHQYRTLGIKNVTVTPMFNGCKGASKTFQINVIGVIASFDYSNTCNDKKTFSFNNTSQGNLSTILWSFSDGPSGTNTSNVIHTFPSSGTFITTLSVTDNITGCSDTYSPPVYTANPSLINRDLTLCKNSATAFSIINNYNNPSANYTWNVIGMNAGPVDSPNLSIKAAMLGNFAKNFVVINNGSPYCPDTIRLNHAILVKGPSVSFKAPDTICFNSLYNVTNTSSPFSANTIVKNWFWNFGISSAGDMGYQPKPFLYDNPGDYNVKLMAVDKEGCKDSIVKTVTVNPIPFLHAIPGIDTLCSGQVDTLIAFHNDPIIWSPAKFLSCSVCDTVIARPIETTTFYVTATNSLGCTSKDSVSVKVYSPFTATPLQRDIYICLYDSTKLNIEPSMKKILWTPSAYLSTANNYAPIAKPIQTTTYTATLTDSAGCFTSSADINVHVKSLPFVNAGADKTCSLFSSYTINPQYSNNVSAYSWTPSTFLSCNNCAAPSGTANYTTTYTIKVTSDSGCIAKDTIVVFVDCKDANILMPTAFSPNGDNLNDLYYPLTRGIKTILRFSIFNRFGNLVYEAKDFPPNDKAFGWNGKMQHIDQSNSVFVYYIEALCDVGQKISRRGSFVMLR